MSGEHYVTRDELNGSLVRIEANQNSGFQRLEANMNNWFGRMERQFHEFQVEVKGETEIAKDLAQTACEKKISKTASALITFLTALSVGCLSALITTIVR